MRNKAALVIQLFRAKKDRQRLSRSNKKEKQFVHIASLSIYSLIAPAELHIALLYLHKVRHPLEGHKTYEEKYRENIQGL
jgi:hypothetical protein